MQAKLKDRIRKRGDKRRQDGMRKSGDKVDKIE